MDIIINLIVARTTVKKKSKIRLIPVHDQKTSSSYIGYAVVGLQEQKSSK